MSTRWSEGRGKCMRKFRCKKKKQEKKKRSNSKSNREKGEREKNKKVPIAVEELLIMMKAPEKNWVCCLLTASEPPFCFTITSSAVIRFYTSEKRPQSTSAGKPHSASRAHNAVFFFPSFSWWMKTSAFWTTGPGITICRLAVFFSFLFT